MATPTKFYKYTTAKTARSILEKGYPPMVVTRALQ